MTVDTWGRIVRYDQQQYLAKNPYGYRCHANTGVPLPLTA